MIVPVVLSGGSGSRLWPLSRETFPKQFIALVGDQTMLQSTVTRLANVADLSSPVVVCNERHQFMVADQLAEVGKSPSAILLEPVGRNTAPAVAIAALEAQADGYDPVLLVLPSDHVIPDSAALCQAVETGKALALQGKLITFGVVPSAPETGYGYIKAGEALEGGDDVTPHASRLTPYQVDRFVEKPDQETAQGYLAAGGYYWNSGMFMFKASRYLEELERFAPDMVSACRESLALATKHRNIVNLEADAFAGCPSDSIDYAVMEKTAAAVVVPLEAGWNDVGSWSALWEVGGKDENGNVRVGDVLALKTRDSYLHAESRLLAAVGVDNLVVVETADAVLVCPKDQVQDVKEIVSRLKDSGRDEAVLHSKVYRPWGAYESIDREERFQVKRITVNPGARLSMQMHHHRAEHWVVVKGTARITKGEEVLILTENQSTYIPLGVTHCLENPGRIPLELIEVQSGSYLGEDDILRFEDIYGRC
ncbi:MAG: mannose-1-phosphate guanylyltransferase/mannose-6-phosphate isomerase [Desulfuromonadales bacterium]|uniref:mannose-1-phosphate guanylyltransferase/mannose-6-phosphate isomerase n=1 Tax=Desulfuromonas sp. KJ2020 TaxID=2919173 RepID=UPI0020A71813|nr:mannose-1-phosphate guanylyltransferase/mannose-6-phosphate isomerase [Desulfuromonas sp. KJ2020]MCP3177590.1 mannose-1-phosphate guanylyltransferase/mannose-6-phosphate isomerase [Desulfuromonas sp. KJ2020]